MIMPSKLISESQTTAETCIKKLAESLKRDTYSERWAGIFRALQGLNNIDYNCIDNPLILLKKLIDLSCGDDAEWQYGWLKREIMYHALIYVYLTLIKCRSHDQVSLRTKTWKSLLEKADQEHVAVLKRPNSSSTRLFQLDLMHIVMNVLLDPEKVKKFKEQVKGVLEHGLEGVASGVLSSTSTIAKTTTKEAVNVINVITILTLGVGGTRFFSPPSQDFSGIKNEIKHIKAVSKIIYDLSKQAKGQLDVSWYVNSMLMYQVAIPASESIKELEELQHSLKDSDKLNWHIIFAGIEALFRVICSTNDTEIRKQALEGNNQYSGLLNYLSFTKSKKTQKLWRSSKEKKNVWRIRQIAAECCIRLSSHKKLGQPVRKMILDTLKERYQAECDERVKNTLFHYDEILQVEASMRMDWGKEESDAEKTISKIEENNEKIKKELIDEIRKISLFDQASIETIIEAQKQVIKKLIKPMAETNTDQKTIEKLSRESETQTIYLNLIMTNFEKIGKNLGENIQFLTKLHEEEKNREAYQLNPPVQPTVSSHIPQIEGLTYRITPGDGNCLYHAVTYYLGNNESMQSLRNLVATELENNIAQYQEFITLLPECTIEKYITDIRINNAWAGDLEINLLMQLLNRPIIVIGPNRNILNQVHLNNFQPTGEPIFVYFNNIDHYDALLLNGSREARGILTGLTPSRNMHSEPNTIAIVVANKLRKQTIYSPDYYTPSPSILSPNTTTGVQNLLLAPKPTNHFIDRMTIEEENYIEKIESIFFSGDGNVSLCLAGLGGIGKTEIAAKYVAQNKEQYNAIFWMNAENGLINDFKRLGNRVSHYIAKQKEDVIPKELVKKVYHKLSCTYSHVLMIFDNALSYGDTIPYIFQKQSNCKFHILITSRNSSNWNASNVNCIYVNVFTPSEAEAFIQKRLGSENIDLPAVPINTQLIEKLGSLPLALQQAISYCIICQISIENYLKEFDDNYQELLNSRLMPDDPHEKTVLTIFTASINKITANNTESEKSAKAFLHICAYIESENIPLTLVQKYLGRKKKLTFIDFKALNSYSLINWNAQTETLSIHRLVQTVVRISLQLQINESKNILENVLLAMKEIFYYRYDAPETWDESFKLIPHIQTAIKHAKEIQLDPIKLTHLCNRLGWVFLAQRRFQQSYEYFSSIMKDSNTYRAQIVGKESLDNQIIEHDITIFNTYEGMIQVIQAKGDFNSQEAIDCLNKKDKIEKALRDYMENNNLPKDLKKRLIDIYLSLFVTLGRFYNAQGASRDAKKYFDDVISESKKQFDNTQNHYVIKALINMARSLWSKKETDFFDTSIKCLEDSIIISRELFKTENHPYIAKAYVEMGRIYRTTGNYENASGCFRTAYEQYLSFYDNEITPDSVTAYRGEGRTLVAQKKLPEAVEHFKTVCEMNDEIYGKETTNAYTRAAYDDLGQSLLLSSSDENDANFTEAFKNLHKAIKPDDLISGFIRSLAHSGRIFINEQAFILLKSEHYYHSIISQYKQISETENSPYVAVAYYDYGRFFQLNEKPDLAKECYYNAHRLMTKLYENHPDKNDLKLHIEQYETFLSRLSL